MRVSNKTPGTPTKSENLIEGNLFFMIDSNNWVECRCFLNESAMSIHQLEKKVKIRLRISSIVKASIASTPTQEFAFHLFIKKGDSYSFAGSSKEQTQLWLRALLKLNNSIKTT